MEQKLSIIVVSHNKACQLTTFVDNLFRDPYTSEIIVIDDYSDDPLSLKNVTLVRNKSALGKTASQAIGLNLAKSPVVLTIDVGVKFKTKEWGKRIIEAVEANPKGVVCPSCISTGNRSFRGKVYGGHLDVLVNRRGRFVVLEPRWNTEPTINGKAECVMGGAYAFNADWHRKIGSFLGIKGYDLTGLVALSLKSRLSGGSVIVLPDVEIENEFGLNAISKPNPRQAIYNKIRLSSVVFPPEVSTLIPTLLANNPGIIEAITDFMNNFGEVINERDLFWGACGSSPIEAAKEAGIPLTIVTQ